jgi:purine catabolism regulator
VLAYENSAVLFHPVEDPQQTTRLKRKTEEIREQLRARLHDAEIACGVGRPARGMENLRQSFSEGEDAVNMSSKLHRTGRATFFGNSSLYNLLLSLKNPAELQRFCMTWLADLIDYDLQQHSDLLETLQTYFANNGNTALTAKELKIHRNTLAYRLNRIAEITRLDLDDADVRLNLHLALKARELLTANTGLLQ